MDVPSSWRVLAMARSKERQASVVLCGIAPWWPQGRSAPVVLAGAHVAMAGVSLAAFLCAWWARQATFDNCGSCSADILQGLGQIRCFFLNYNNFPCLFCSVDI